MAATLAGWGETGAASAQEGASIRYRAHGPVVIDHSPDRRWARVTATGGISVIGPDFLLRAEAFVLWCDPGALEPRRTRSLRPRPFYGEKPQERAVPRAAVHALYAEGGVHFQRGHEVIRAERFFFDFRRGRGEVLSAYLGTRLELGRGRHLPLHVRAERVRFTGRLGPGALSAWETLHARNLALTTCEYDPPHYVLAAASFRAARLAGGYTEASLSHVTLRAWGLPLLYLPYVWGRSTGGTGAPLQDAAVESSRRFGTFVHTAWGEDILLTDQDGTRRRWGTWRLDLDHRTRRGPGGGLTLEYRTKAYHGLLTGYYVRDRATDISGGGFIPPGRDRGRLRLFHRHELAPGLRLDLEGAWLRDRNFLLEYFETEARTEKIQENYVRLAYDRRDWTVRLLYRPRLNDFFTRTEYLPRLSARLFSHPLLPGGFLSTNLYLDVDAEAARGRFRPDEALKQPDLETDRGDVVASLALPVRVGPLFLDAFGQGRFTAWSRTARQEEPDTRYAFAAGARLHAQFWRVYPQALAGLDVRHVVTPQILYANTFRVSRPVTGLVILDERDLLSPREVLTLRLQQRLQVRPGTQVLDVAELTAEMPFFPHPDRDNAGRGKGPLFLDLKAGFPPVFLLADALFDFETNDVTLFNLGVQTLLPSWPGLAPSGGGLFVSERIVKGLAHVVSAGAFLRLGPKWTLGALAQRDFRSRRNLDQRLVLGRTFHRFRLELEFYKDGGSNDRGIRLRFGPLELFRGLDRLRRQFATGRFLGDY